MSNRTLRAAFIGPLGGAALGPGMVYMAGQVDSWKIPGWFVEGKFFPWENWQQAGAWVSEAEVRVAAGYSNGGNTASWIANYSGYLDPVDLDLLIGLDPTIWLDNPTILQTVKRAYCYYNGNYIPWFTQFVGHAKYKLAPGNTFTRLTVETIYDWHGNVDKNPQRQQAILKMIKDFTNA